MKTMKKLLFACLAAGLLFTACKEKPSYDIKGTVVGEGVDGKVVYLKKIDENYKPGAVKDSAVVKNGAFEIKGSVDTTNVYVLEVENGKVNLFLDNVPYTITFDLNAPAANKVAGGSKSDSLMNALNDETAPLNDRLMALQNAYMEAKSKGTLTDSLKDKIVSEADSLQKMQQTMGDTFLDNNTNTLVGAFLISRMMPSMEREKLEAYATKFDDNLKANQFTKKIFEKIDNMKRTEVGQRFVDIRMPDPNGKEIALSDYAGKGKYVLIDFWASWCGPCRHENPNVVALYAKYKDKGFEIVGISLDREAESWKKAIKDDGITWPQMSDLQFWQSAGARLYSVGSIPHTILLDKEGVIIAKDLRGEELEAKVAELLK